MRYGMCARCGAQSAMKKGLQHCAAGPGVSGKTQRGGPVIVRS